MLRRACLTAVCVVAVGSTGGAAMATTWTLLAARCFRNPGEMHCVFDAWSDSAGDDASTSSAFETAMARYSTMDSVTRAGTAPQPSHSHMFHPVDACATREFVALAKRMGQERLRVPGAGMVVNTCRSLEGEFLDVLAAQSASSSDGHKLFAVGPLNPLLVSVPDKATRHQCLEWLDGQPPSSVLYISFGTTSSLRAEQVRELATALRDSNQRFIWALRDADRADMRVPGA